MAANVALYAFVGLAGAGGVYLATRDDDGPAPVKTPIKTFTVSTLAIQKASTQLAPASSMTNPYTQWGLKSFGNRSTSASALEQEALRRIEAEYNALDARARKAGADKLNAALGTKLTGNESFGEAAAAVAAVAAAAGCAATGVGTTVAGLCAMAGAYLGKKIGDYIEGAAGEVADWAKDTAENLYNSTIGRFW